MKSAVLISAALSAVGRLSHASPLNQRADEPCGQLRDAVDKWYKDNNIVPKLPTNALEAATVPSVPAAPVLPSLAFACLKSVPLDKETAIKHIDHLRPQWQWHSTIEYLKNPPWGYLSEPVDLLGGLDQIKAKLQGDAYRSEFDFLADLHMLSRVRVRESHFHAGSALLDLFSFKTGAEFVAVSKDGLALPEIFVQEDIKHDKEKYSPSAVSTIDGVPALTYLKIASSLVGSAHDPDTRYNEVTWSLAKASTYYPSENNIHDLGLNDTTTVQFENKTVRIFSNTAFVRANLTNVTSAASLYNTYGRGEGTAPLPLPWASYKRTYELNYTAAWSGYPTPANRTVNGGAAGFLPTSPKLKDTVVLAVPTFDFALNPSDIQGFFSPEWPLWNLTADVLTRARAENRTKLILDMQGNTGGLLSTMTALYYAFFPTDSNYTFPFHFQARAHPQLAWLVNRFTATAAPNTTKWIWNFSNAQQYVDITTRKPFPTFATWYGPPTAYEPDLTPPFYLNLTRMLDSTFWPRLNPPNSPFTTQWYKPEDITILTDGTCGSACAIFVDTLTRLHGVKTVVVGGRPLNRPMQAIGRVRGGPAVSFQSWESSVLAKKWEVPEGLELVEGAAPLRMTGNGNTTFNLFNMRDPNDEGDAPLQFSYSVADCRVWWTWEMGREMERVWEKAAEVMWGGGSVLRGRRGGMGKILGIWGIRMRCWMRSSSATGRGG